jgi:hypothetical protein
LADASSSPAVAQQSVPMARSRAGQWIIFVALAFFLPIPFMVPFWATASVPVSYLISSGSRVGKIGVAYGLVAAVGLFIVSTLLNRLLTLIPNRIARNVLVIALMLILAIASLLPIYRPRMDPLRPGINIVTLFQQGIPVGQ